MNDSHDSFARAFTIIGEAFLRAAAEFKRDASQKDSDAPRLSTVDAMRRVMRHWAQWTRKDMEKKLTGHSRAAISSAIQRLRKLEEVEVLQAGGRSCPGVYAETIPL